MAWLIVKLGGHPLSRHELTKKETTVGRDRECDVVIDNPAISRVHAIVRNHGHWHTIEDAGTSKNGLYYEGRLVREQLRLVHDAEVVIGKYTLGFDAEGKAHEPESLPPPMRTGGSQNPIPTTVMKYVPYVTAKPPGRSPLSKARFWQQLWFGLIAAFLAALAWRLYGR